MEPMEKNVEKQIIVRAYAPDMSVLKSTAKMVSVQPDTKLALYGQLGEVLVSITVKAYAAAAATELSEAAALQFETALGDTVYGRGKGTLAHAAAGELIQHECIMVAANQETGDYLSEEFSTTKRGEKVFDFGEDTYKNPKIAPKINERAAKQIGDDAHPAQTAASLAVAAAKCGHAEFGVAFAGLGDAQVYSAVSYKGKVYIRRLTAGQGAGKAAAMAALDLVRRLLRKQPLPHTKTFAANAPVDWHNPGKGGAPRFLAPMIVILVLVAALGVACWYYFTHFVVPGNDDALPVGSGSLSASIEDSLPGVPDSVPQAEDPTPPENNIPAGGQAPQQMPAADENGVVHPFT